MKVKLGEVSDAKIIKAGCGVRYDPEQLGDHTGFDFSDASKLRFNTSEDITKKDSDKELKRADERKTSEE